MSCVQALQWPPGSAAALHPPQPEHPPIFTVRCCEDSPSQQLSSSLGSPVWVWGPAHTEGTSAFLTVTHGSRPVPLSTPPASLSVASAARPPLQDFCSARRQGLLGDGRSSFAAVFVGGDEHIVSPSAIRLQSWGPRTVVLFLQQCSPQGTDL